MLIISNSVHIIAMSSRSTRSAAKAGKRNAANIFNGKLVKQSVAQDAEVAKANKSPK